MARSTPGSSSTVSRTGLAKVMVLLLEMRCSGNLIRVFIFFPLYKFQIHDEDRVNYRYKQKSNKRGDGQPTYLSVTERFPQRPSVGGEGDERDDRCADRDEDGPEPHDACI